jgi:hypothetical protein
MCARLHGCGSAYIRSRQDPLPAEDIVPIPRARLTSPSTRRSASGSTPAGSRSARRWAMKSKIRSGLHGGEQAVVSGQQKLREGSLVEIGGGAR